MVRPLLVWVASHSGFSPKGREAGPSTSGWSRAVGQALAASHSPVSFQDPALKLCLVQSVCMASQAICSSAQAGSFHFSRKAELVAQMIVSAGWGLPGSWGGFKGAAADRGGGPGEGWGDPCTHLG